MAYKNGTYVAFDGNGEVDPSKSDQRYFDILKAWNASGSIDFSFSDSHSKTYQVRDDSSDETLKQRLQERLSNSKNMLIIISDDTNYDRGLLNWEIEQAVDYYKIPLIIAYTEYLTILNPLSHEKEWPKSLKNRIEDSSAHCIHIPFKKEPIWDAIGQFYSNSTGQKYPKGGSLGSYSKQAYEEWGLL